LGAGLSFWESIIAHLADVVWCEQGKRSRRTNGANEEPEKRAGAAAWAAVSIPRSRVKKGPFSRHAPLPPALVALAAVLADIAKNRKDNTRAPTDDEANLDHEKEARNAGTSLRGGGPRPP